MIQGANESFPDFLAALHEAPTSESSREFALRANGSTLAADVKSHLLAYYENVQSLGSYTDDDGRIFDCVPVDRQPAAHLINGIPDPPFADAPSPGLRGLIEANPAVFRQCPEGTVPLRRLTLSDAARFSSLDAFLKLNQRKRKPSPDQESAGGAASGAFLDYPHRYAVAYQRTPNLGGQSSVNLWKPAVTGRQIMSLSQIWCSAGIQAGETLQTAEAGWQVCQNNFPESQGNPVFFIYWTADNYGATGAYNNRDGHFFIKSSAFPIGGIFSTTSVAGGPQYEVELSYYCSGGNWWLYVGGVAIGFWPASIYGNGPMTNGAAEVMFGGETDGNSDYPPMGSGALPPAGYAHAAYHRNISYFDPSNNVVPAQLIAITPAPRGYGIDIGQPAAASGAAWGSYFYFGGPGGA